MSCCWWRCFTKNLTVPETRGIALLGFATGLSLAVGYELSMRGWHSDWALPIVLGIPAIVGAGYGIWQFLFTPISAGRTAAGGGRTHAAFHLPRKTGSG